MDEVKINITNGFTKWVVSRLLTNFLKKKLGVDSFKVSIDNLFITTFPDTGEVSFRIDAVASAKKKELLEKLEEVTL